MSLRPGRLGLVIAAALLVGAGGLSELSAQDPTASGSSNERRMYRTTGSRVALGRDIHVAVDEEVTDAVVAIGGSVRVDGRVRDGVVAIGGSVELGPQADVRGDVVVVGGRLTRAQGARLTGSVSDISLVDWSPWQWSGGSFPRVDTGGFGRWIGLLGTVFRLSLLALMMGLLLLVARAPVTRVGRAAASEPARAFLVGLAAMLLFLPALLVASVGLIITLIGIPLVAVLVPLAFFTAFIALILGFTGIACSLGEWVEDRLGWRGRSAVVATAIGLLLIVAPTVVSRMVGLAPDPVRAAASALLLSGILLEFIVWTTGLGATLLTGFGRWSTAPPPVPPSPQPFVVVEP